LVCPNEGEAAITIKEFEADVEKHVPGKAQKERIWDDA
jgi:hypothetical protein